MAQNFSNFQDLSADDKNVCRACMTKKNDMICVFNNKKLKTCEMLEFCTGIRISRNDILPKKICNRCLTKLEIAYKFKKDCLQTEEALHAAFEKHGLEAEEIEEENMETVIESLETDINLKEDVKDLNEEIIKEVLLTMTEENDYDYYDDDVTVCISDDDDDDFKDLDHKTVGPIKNAPSNPCANECKTTKQLIAKIPPGVSVKIINNSKSHKENTEQIIIGKNMKTVNKVKSKKCVQKTLQEKLLTSDGILFEQNLGELLKKNIPSATERRLYCSKCDIQFKSTGEIKEHRRNLHPFVATICAVCGAIPSTRQSQHRHMKSHEVPSHKCEFCDYATSYARDLDTHLRVHKDIKDYFCEYCTKSFRNLSNLKFHIRHHHGSVEKKHACPRCSYKTYNKSKLMRHMDAHDNIKRYECEICKSRYARRQKWKKHVQTAHNILIPRIRPGRKKNGIQCTNIESNLSKLQVNHSQSDVNLKSKQDTNVSSDVSLKDLQDKCLSSGVSLARVEKVNESDETVI